MESVYSDDNLDIKQYFEHVKAATEKSNIFYSVSLWKYGGVSSTGTLFYWRLSRCCA